jgi:hypothetical protein
MLLIKHRKFDIQCGDNILQGISVTLKDVNVRHHKMLLTKFLINCKYAKMT